MSRQRTPSRRKTFTVQQANAMLPLVRAIVGDLVRLSSEVVERRQRLTSLSRNRRRPAIGFYRDELNHAEAELDRDTQRLQGYVEELTALGVDPQDASEGLVDFPAMLGGRLVYLCWKLGEPEISYWHELDAGFQGRQPLGQTSLAGGGKDS
jgi:hypothetical protein